MNTTLAVEFMVMCVKDGKTEGLGLHKFPVPPRVGEYFILRKQDEEKAYKIRAVIYAMDEPGTAGDLFVEHFGNAMGLYSHLQQS